GGRRAGRDRVARCSLTRTSIVTSEETILDSRITDLFAGVTRRGFSRLVRFLRRLVIGLDPLGVKNTWLVHALVSVRAEEIALCLSQIRWQPRGAITAEVSARRAQRGE